MSKYENFYSTVMSKDEACSLLGVPKATYNGWITRGLDFVPEKQYPPAGTPILSGSPAFYRIEDVKALLYRFDYSITHKQITEKFGMSISDLNKMVYHGVAPPPWYRGSGRSMNERFRYDLWDEMPSLDVESFPSVIRKDYVLHDSSDLDIGGLHTYLTSTGFLRVIGVGEGDYKILCTKCDNVDTATEFEVYRMCLSHSIQCFPSVVVDYLDSDDLL